MFIVQTYDICKRQAEILYFIKSAIFKHFYTIFPYMFDNFVQHYLKTKFSLKL